MSDEPKPNEVEDDDAPFDASTIIVRRDPARHNDPRFSQEAINERRRAAKEDALKRKD